MPDSLSQTIRNVLARNVRIFSVNDEPAMVDATGEAGAITTLDTRHNRIHRGQLFHYDAIASAGAGAAIAFLLRVGDNPAHCRVFGSGSALVRLLFYEDVTVSSQGTQQALQNRNRNSTLAPKARIFTGGSISGITNNNLIMDVYVPTGGGVLDVLAQTEWLLKPNTDYYFQVVNASSAQASIGAIIELYENVFHP